MNDKERLKESKDTWPLNAIWIGLWTRKEINIRGGKELFYSIKGIIRKNGKICMPGDEMIVFSSC